MANSKKRNQSKKAKQRLKNYKKTSQKQLMIVRRLTGDKNMTINDAKQFMHAMNQTNPKNIFLSAIRSVKDILGHFDNIKEIGQDPEFVSKVNEIGEGSTPLKQLIDASNYLVEKNAQIEEVQEKHMSVIESLPDSKIPDLALIQAVEEIEMIQSNLEENAVSLGSLNELIIQAAYENKLEEVA